jgi:Holliday junction resolvase RusA-like endonuclease
VQIRVSGTPTSQGSKRVYNGRIVEAAGKNLKVWRKAIADACLAEIKEDHRLLLGPVRVEVVFHLLRPKSVSEKQRALPIVPPDVDKLLRGLLDGIGQSEVVWGDDSQVVEAYATKIYNPEWSGAEVTITEI